MSEELRELFAGSQNEVEPQRYEPKMNVTLTLSQPKNKISADPTEFEVWMFWKQLKSVNRSEF